MSTDVYSSTDEPSSDDRSSVNSVIYVQTVPEAGFDSEPEVSGVVVAPFPGVVDSDLEPNARAGRHATGDDTSSDSETSLDERHDSDTSSSSDGTQVWVPTKGGLKPAQLRNSHHSNTVAVMRNSIVSQNSATGKLETSIISEEAVFGGDSGISNESPETHSSAEHHLHLTAAHSALRAGPHSHIIPLPALPSPPASPQVAKQQRTDDSDGHAITNTAEMDAHIRESLFNILSGLYALLLIVMGIALPIAEIFAEPVTPGMFEGFYIYLYAVSIVFLLYVYVFLLRARTLSRRCWRDKSGRNTDSLLRKAHRNLISVTSSHTGSFYLRLGAVGFAIGAMIHEGLIFGGLFEMKLSSPCMSLSEIIRPVLHFAFTFIQLYFIFLNSKMCIHRYKIFARFGLMHMIATNICVWLHTVTIETVREVREHINDPRVNTQGMMHLLGHVSLLHNKSTAVTTTTTTPSPIPYAVVETHPVNSTGGTNGSSNLEVECRRQDIMSNVVESASPYLYPCTIQYSLIATGILYFMWSNIGKRTSGRLGIEGRESLIEKKRHHIHVDCSGANRGLFFGIFTLVATIISMIVFFVLVERPEYVSSAILIVHSAELVLYCLALVAIVVAFYKIRDMRFHSDCDNSLDESLLLIALTGHFTFCIFSVMAGHYNTDTNGGTLVMSTSILILCEAVLQTVFILNGLRRSPLKPYHESKKPGREYVTFLLVVNIAMWGINLFEVLRSNSNPITLNFYGLLLWNIITHMSTPMVIFYRFHSSVCLANIWKNAYKQKLH